MKTCAEIQSALEATTDELDGARRKVESGFPLDLSDLGGRVESICRAIETLPVGERTRFQGPIVSLIDELDKLAGSITRHRDGLEQGLKSISVRQQASSAYGKSPPNRSK